MVVASLVLEPLAHWHIGILSMSMSMEWSISIGKRNGTPALYTFDAGKTLIYMNESERKKSVFSIDLWSLSIFITISEGTCRSIINV